MKTTTAAIGDPARLVHQMRRRPREPAGRIQRRPDRRDRRGSSAPRFPRPPTARRRAAAACRSSGAHHPDRRTAPCSSPCPCGRRCATRRRRPPRPRRAGSRERSPCGSCRPSGRWLPRRTAMRRRDAGMTPCAAPTSTASSRVGSPATVGPERQHLSTERVGVVDHAVASGVYRKQSPRSSSYSGEVLGDERRTRLRGVPPVDRDRPGSPPRCLSRRTTSRSRSECSRRSRRSASARRSDTPSRRPTTPASDASLQHAAGRAPPSARHRAGDRRSAAARTPSARARACRPTRPWAPRAPA